MPFSDRSPKIALIGFMGAGKTSVGRALSRATRFPFVDLDEAIEEAAGMSVRAIFAEKGEAVFRARETDALRSIASKAGGMVLACGGGVVISAANRDLLSREFVAVWLEVPFEELMLRLSFESERAARPLLRSEGYKKEAEAMYRAREPLYREACRFACRWRQGESAEDVAAVVATMLGSLSTP